MKNNDIDLDFVLYSIDSPQYFHMIEDFNYGNENINTFLKNLDKNKYPSEYVIILLHSVPDAINFYERNDFIQIKDNTSIIKFKNISINDCQLMVFIL